MVVEYIANLIINAISALGYLGVFFLMLMESTVLPIPSEVVMPFAGFLIAEGRFNILGIVIASSLGSLAGSLISYYIGKIGGRPLIINYGKYFFMNKKHLELTEKFFLKKGDKAILISRFIPVIRHIISLPAGIAKMNIKKFILYTLLGATTWNMFLAFLGFKLKENWHLINKFSTELDILIIIILFIIVIYFIIRKIKK